MPPFRVVARHPSKDHPDHAWHQVAGSLDYQADAVQAAKRPPDLALGEPISSDPDEPVRPDPDRALAEAAASAYELKAQELVESGEGHRWKDC